jgi:hypothetical protein
VPVTRVTLCSTPPRLGAALVNGSKCGPWGAVSGNNIYGVQILAGTANNFSIVNCDLRGNTVGSIGDASSGTTARLKINNKGYNPQPAVAITVGASPFTLAPLVRQKI